MDTRTIRINNLIRQTENDAKAVGKFIFSSVIILIIYAALFQRAPFLIHDGPGIGKYKIPEQATKILCPQPATSELEQLFQESLKEYDGRNHSFQTVCALGGSFGDYESAATQIAAKAAVENGWSADWSNAKIKVNAQVSIIEIQNGQDKTSYIAIVRSYNDGYWIIQARTAKILGIFK